MAWRAIAGNASRVTSRSRRLLDMPSASNVHRTKSILGAAGVSTQGQPVLARYNGPMTPWFMRRNEIWLALK